MPGLDYALIHSGRYNNPTNRPYAGPEVNYTNANNTYLIYNHSGFIALLPYIEQENLYQKIDRPRTAPWYDTMSPASSSQYQPNSNFVAAPS